MALKHVGDGCAGHDDDDGPGVNDRSHLQSVAVLGRSDHGFGRGYPVSKPFLTGKPFFARWLLPSEQRAYKRADVLTRFFDGST
jgi:hypothetical protein